MIKNFSRLARTAGLFILLVTSACLGKGGAAPSTITQPLPTRAAAPASTQSSEQRNNTPGDHFGPPLVLSGHTGAVSHLAWSPDGALLASACGDFDAQDFTIRLWRADGTPVAALQGHQQPVTGLAWSPDGQILASSSLDETIRLWRPDGSLLKVLEGHTGRVFAVAWSPDGKTLASASIVSFLNPTVQLWNLDGQVIKTLGTSFSGGKFYNLAWSPDGRFLLGGATDYKLWRSDGTPVYWLERSEHSTPAWGMTWSPDSRLWAIGNENGTLSIFNLEGSQVASVQDQSGLNSLAWSPDGREIAGAKTLWHADGSLIKRLSGQPQYMYSVAWSPDGQILASGGSDPSVHLWTSDGAPLSNLSGHTGEVRLVAWSPTGRILASASADQTIRLWPRR